MSILVARCNQCDKVCTPATTINAEWRGYPTTRHFCSSCATRAGLVQYDSVEITVRNAIAYFQSLNTVFNQTQVIDRAEMSRHVLAKYHPDLLEEVRKAAEESLSKAIEHAIALLESENRIFTIEQVANTAGVTSVNLRRHYKDVFCRVSHATKQSVKRAMEQAIASFDGKFTVSQACTKAGTTVTLLVKFHPELHEQVKRAANRSQANPGVRGVSPIFHEYQRVNNPDTHISKIGA